MAVVELRPSGNAGSFTSYALWNVATDPNGTVMADDSDSTYQGVSTNTANQYAKSFDLADVPVDLATVTGVRVKVRYAWSATPTSTTWDYIWVRVVDSGGGRLADNGSGAADYFDIIATAITTTTPTTTSYSPLNTILTTDKTTWDGASVVVRLDRGRVKGGGSEEQRIHEVWVEVTYDTASAFSPVDPMGMNGIFGI